MKHVLGLTFEFSKETEDYANDINIRWIRDNTELENINYTPNDTTYFCSKTVTRFNKIIITVKGMNKAYRYLKIQDIMYGTERVFNQDDLRNVELLEDSSLTSEDLRINTMDFTLSNSTGIELDFQRKQPLELWWDNTLLGCFFVETSKRKSKSVYEIESQDYIGLLDRFVFNEKTYNNASVSTIVADILGNVPYTLESTIGNKTLSGTIKKCTCRQALMQVLFATCSVADTSRRKDIWIYKPDYTTIESEIDNGIYTGSTFTQNEVITEIRLVLNNETVISKLNPNVESGALNNILEFSGDLISTNNGNEVLNYLFDFYCTKGNSTSTLKFIVNNDEKIGDLITFDTEFLGTKKGIISRMKFNFNSMKLVANADVKEVIENG